MTSDIRPDVTRGELFDPEGPHDRRLAASAAGLLRTFNEAGVLESPDVLVAQRVAALVDEPDETVRLAVALAVRAVRRGSVAPQADRCAGAGSRSSSARR